MHKVLDRLSNEQESATRTTSSAGWTDNTMRVLLSLCTLAIQCVCVIITCTHVCHHHGINSLVQF